MDTRIIVLTRPSYLRMAITPLSASPLAPDRLARQAGGQNRLHPPHIPPIAELLLSIVLSIKDSISH